MNTPNLAPLIFKRFSLDEDLALFHSWLTQPYAKYWGMTDKAIEEIKAEYQELLTDGHTECYFGYMGNSSEDASENAPVCFMETYDPNQSPLTHHTSIEAGDVGFHILLAPNETPIKGFGKHVFGQSLKFLFDEKKAQRILVEPDINNEKIHKLNREFGFHHQKRIQLDNKVAYLGICDKTQFEFASNTQRTSKENQPVDLTDHEGFTKINRHLVKKGLTELLHERIFNAKRISSRSYEITIESSGISYFFTGEEIALEHLIIDADSIVRTNDRGDRLNLALTSFFLDFAEILGLQGKQLADYLEEINSTVYSLLYKYQQGDKSYDLLNADFQTVEKAMIEGHPIFIANSGRIGFDTNDFLGYSPEAATPMPLLWLAAHKTRCEISLGDGLTYESLIESELDATDRDRFERSLTSQGAHPGEYYYLPVHPWQWTNKIQQLYIEDLVDQSLIYLGESTDRFQPQQSIRTFFNQSQYGKRYIKVALSITNMGFVRGLSADYMAVTPAINDYIHQLLANDPVISQLPFAILKEDAALGYRQPTFNQGELKDAPFRKMLACLYRENPFHQIEPHQQLKTMASLLQVDFDGNALLPEIIKASGLTIEKWLDTYFLVYLTPLLQCFYRHKLVFMPHGENLILVFDNHVPVKAFMKDIGEEVCLLNVSPDGLPEAVKRIAITMPEDQELLSIFTDVFDDFFRFLSVILYQKMAFSDQCFWQAVADHINKFKKANPDLAPLFKKHDLFVETFDHSCLNRLQLGNNKQMVDLTDPAGSLQFAGKIVNPIAKFR